MEKDKKTDPYYILWLKEYLLKPFFKVYLFLSLNGKKKDFFFEEKGIISSKFFL